VTFCVARDARNEGAIMELPNHPAIAAHYGGFDFVGMELDEDYYKAACERFDRETAQAALDL